MLTEERLCQRCRPQAGDIFRIPSERNRRLAELYHKSGDDEASAKLLLEILYTEE